MNFARFGLLLLPISLAFSQSLFEKAPPAMDAALRTRVGSFYQAHIDGKLRVAYEMVTEDSKEYFLSSGKPKLHACDITKVDYSEDFSKADVLVGCKGTFSFHGQMMTVTFPLSSQWIQSEGQWYWHAAQAKGRDTPWGFWGEKDEPAGGPTANPNSASGAARLAMGADPAALARQILNNVKIDKTDVLLRGYESSKDEVHITNGMAGPITLAVDALGMKGLTIKAQKTQLNAGEETAVTFDYSIDEASALCGECAKRAKGSATVNIRVQPTNQVFAVNLTFAIPPELQKQLPAEIQKQLPKP